MIELNFTLTEEDLFEFNYYTSWKAQWNKKKRILYYFKAILYAGIGIVVVHLISKSKFSWQGFIVTLFILGIYLVFIDPLRIRNFYKKIVEKMSRDTQNENFFLPTILEIDEKGIKSRDSMAETFYQWSAFVRKAIIKDYTYLYLNSQLALVIPDRIFKDQKEKNEFEKLLAQYLPIQAEFSHTLQNS